MHWITFYGELLFNLLMESVKPPRQRGAATESLPPHLLKVVSVICAATDTARLKRHACD